MKFHVLYSMWVLYVFFGMTTEVNAKLEFSRTRLNITTSSIAKVDTRILSFAKGNTTTLNSPKGSTTTVNNAKGNITTVDYTKGNTTTFNYTKVSTITLNHTKGNTTSHNYTNGTTTLISAAKVDSTAYNLTKANSSTAFNTTKGDSTTEHKQYEHGKNGTRLNQTEKARRGVVDAECLTIVLRHRILTFLSDCVTEFCYNIMNQMPKIKMLELTGIHIQPEHFMPTPGAANWTMVSESKLRLNLTGVKHDRSEIFCFRVQGNIRQQSVTAELTKYNGHVCDRTIPGPSAKQGDCFQQRRIIKKSKIAGAPNFKSGQKERDDDLFTEAEEADVDEKSAVFARTADISSSDDEGLGVVNGALSTGGPIVQGRADGMTSATPNIGVPPGTGWTQTC